MGDEAEEVCIHSHLHKHEKSSVNRVNEGYKVYVYIFKNIHTKQYNVSECRPRYVVKA